MDVAEPEAEAKLHHVRSNKHLENPLMRLPEDRSGDEYSDDDDHTAGYDGLEELDLNLPIAFGSESTLVSSKALTVINDRIKYDNEKDARIAAMVVQQDNHVLEATSCG